MKIIHKSFNRSRLSRQRTLEILKVPKVSLQRRTRSSSTGSKWQSSWLLCFVAGLKSNWRKGSLSAPRSRSTQLCRISRSRSTLSGRCRRSWPPWSGGASCSTGCKGRCFTGSSSCGENLKIGWEVEKSSHLALPCQQQTDTTISVNETWVYRSLWGVWHTSFLIQLIHNLHLLSEVINKLRTTSKCQPRTFSIVWHPNHVHQQPYLQRVMAVALDDIQTELADLDIEVREFLWPALI